MTEDQLKPDFGTLWETINGLVKLGYTHDFNIQDECIVCDKTNLVLSPEEFRIDHVYRFDGDSDPEYQSVLYAISSTQHDVKGTLVDGYGISYNEISLRLIEKLRTNEDHLAYTLNSTQTEEVRSKTQKTSCITTVQNLQEQIEKLKSEYVWKSGDRNSVTLVKSDELRIVLIGLHAGAELKPHKANGAISLHVLAGEILFIAEDKNMNLQKGQLAALTDNILHSVKAVQESFFLLTMAMKK